MIAPPSDDEDIRGFDPAFEAEVRRAMVAAGLAGRCSVQARHLLDDAASYRAGAAEPPAHPQLHVLWEADEVWIGRSGRGGGCIGCFRSWRMHRWRAALAKQPPGSFIAPVLPPMARAWIAGLIASVAADGRRPRAPLSTMRCASIREGSARDHHYLPHPDCPLCAQPASAGASAAAPDDGPPRAPGYRAVGSATLRDETMPLLLDERCGLVRRLSSSRRTRFLPVTRAELHPVAAPSQVEWGYGRTGDSGKDGAVATLEALERYCGMVPRNRPEVVSGCYAELQEEAADPESFILHAPEQREEPGFALAVYSPDTIYDWVWGHSLRRGGPVLVPLQLAFYNLEALGPVRGGRFVQEVSNGCAAGASRAEAALHGLLEAIERDAFLRAWYGRRPLRRIEPEGCADPMVGALVARLAAEGLDLQVYDLAGATAAAAAFAVAVADSSCRLGPALAVAAGAHFDPSTALRGALAEAVTNFGHHDEHIRAERRARADRLLANPGRVRRMDDHAAQGWSPAALDTRGFQVSPEPPLAWSDRASLPASREPVDISAALARLGAATMERCEDVILIDQSFPRLPVRCVKVLAPGLLPMTFGHQYRRIPSGHREHAAPLPHLFP